MSRVQRKKTYWHGAQNVELKSEGKVAQNNEPRSIDSVFNDELDSVVLGGGFVQHQRPLVQVPSSTALNSNVPFTQQQGIIYGPLFAGCINMSTFHKINGQGFSIGPKAYAPGAPGSLSCQIRNDDFVFSLAPLISGAEYIARRGMLPKFAASNGKNMLAANSLGGRVCFTIQDRPFFLFADLSMTSSGGVTSENIQSMAIVFTWDSLGGSAGLELNSPFDGPLTTSQTIGTSVYDSVIGLIPGAPFAPPGSSVFCVPTCNFGVLFYASLISSVGTVCPFINIMQPSTGNMCV